MQEILGFSEKDIGRLSAVVAAYESGALGGPKLSQDSQGQRLYTRIAYRNDAGESAPAYGLLRITGRVAVDDMTMFTIAKPNTTFCRRYLVNGPDDVDNGGYGWATWLWHSDYILYDSTGTPALNEEWGAKSAEWKLFANRPGFLIDGSTTGSGSTARVIAQQIITQQVFGLADAAIALNASGTVRVYGGTPGSEADTGQTISSVFFGTAAVADEGEVYVGWMHGKPYGTPATCP